MSLRNASSRSVWLADTWNIRPKQQTWEKMAEGMTKGVEVEREVVPVELERPASIGARLAEYREPEVLGAEARARAPVG